MALHILQPGLRPMGQFDLEGSQTVTGGEIGVLTYDTDTGAVAQDRAAADALNVGPLATQAVAAAIGDKIHVQLGQPALADDGGNTADSAELVSGFRFLLDEGVSQYGTLFGAAIGGTAGQGVTFGLSESGSVLANLGPNTSFASGKVTCWHAPGLYAVSGDTAAASLAANDLNAVLGASSGGILQAHATGDAVALYLGGLHDESLVSTSSLAATGTQGDAAKFAIYFLGQR